MKHWILDQVTVNKETIIGGWKNGEKCGKKKKKTEKVKWQPMLYTGITFGENIIWD